MEIESDSLDGGYEGSVYDSSLESPAVVPGGVAPTPNSLASPDSPDLMPHKPKFDFSLGNGHKTTLFLLNAGVIILIALIGVGGYLLAGSHKSANELAKAKTDSFKVVTLSVENVRGTDELNLGNAERLAVNGDLKVTGSLLLNPGNAPTNPVAGQIYFDKTTNVPYYYNGTAFVSMAQAAAANGGTVSTIQGQTGAVTFTGAGGVAVSGTTITNTGVTSLQGTANQLAVSQTTGGITLSLPQDIAPGSSPTFAGLTVSGLAANGVVVTGANGQLAAVSTASNGLCLISNNGVPVWGSCSGISGTPGAIAYFGPGGELADSLITQSGSTISVGAALNVSGIISGNGSGITNLNANNVTSGTLAVAYGGTGANNAADARGNLGAAARGINGDITSLTALSSITPATALTIGSVDQTLTLQGSASSTISASGNGVSTTLNFATPLTAASILIPNTSGTLAVRATGPLVLGVDGIVTCPTCLVDNSGGGGGGIPGVVSINSFSGALNLVQGTGIVVDNNSGTITVNAAQDIAATATPTFAGLLLNGALGVGLSNPSYPVDVNGDVNVSGSFKINGVTICTSSGCAASGGGANYINNSTTIQTGAAFAVQGSNINAGVGVIRGASGQVANIFSVQNSSGVTHLTVAADGKVGIGTATPGYTLDVNGDVNVNSGSTFRINGVPLCASGTCAPASGSANYVNNTTTQQTGNFALQSASASSVGGVVRGANGQTANLFEARAGSNNATLFAITAAGDVYTSTGKLGVANNAPAYPLDVVGDINTTGIFRINGTNICDATGCVARGGTGSYINNSTSPQTANLNIQSGSAGSITALIKGAASQTANILEVQNSSNATLFRVNPSGSAYVSSSLGVGVSSPSYALDVQGDINIQTGGSLRIGGNVVCNSSGCGAGGGSGSYIQNGTSNQNANFAITSAAASGLPTAVIKQAGGQTGDLLQLQGSGGSTVAAINPSGQLLVASATAYNGALNVGTNTSSAGGGIYFGSDTNLYRVGGAALKTDGSLQASGFSQTSADFSSGLTLQSSTLNSTRSTNLTFKDNQGSPQTVSLRKEGTTLAVLDNNGNTQVGFNTATGGLLFGTSFDTNLYRSGSNALTTDGALTVAGTFTASANALFRAATNSSSAFRVQNSTGTNVLVADTTTGRVSINSSSAANYPLDVNGDINTTGVYRINGVTICQSSGCTPTSGSQAYIQNGITTQSGNFNLSSNIAGGVSVGTPTALLKQANTQIGDLLQLQDSSGTTTSGFSANGSQLKLSGAAAYTAAITIGTSSDTTADKGISFGGDAGLYRSAAGTLSLQGTSTAATLQAAPTAGTDVSGLSLNLSAGQGTGAGNGGNINLQIAPANSAPNQSFVTTANNPYDVAVDSTYIYWVNQTAGSIGRANIDGTGATQSFITGISGLRYITVNGSYIYWTATGSGTIGRANIDGTGVNNSFITGVTPMGITADASYIYWSNTGTSSIGRANLDGTSPNSSFVGSLGTGITDIAVNASYVYWTKSTSTNGWIGRANLDGTSPNTTFISGLGGTNATGISLSSTYIYWSNLASNTLGRASLNGAGVDNNFITGATSPRGIVASANYLYWTNQGGTTVGRASLGSTSVNVPLTVMTIAGNNGAALFKNATDSTAAFQVQNAAGSSVFTIDTTNGRLAVGTAAAAANGVLTVGTSTTNAAGGLYFGTDTDLYRSAAGLLRTDGGFATGAISTANGPGASSGVYASSDGFLKSVRATGTSDAVSVGVVGDTSARLAVQASGQLRFGSGASAADTYLSRSAAGTLSLQSTTTNTATLQSADGTGIDAAGQNLNIAAGGSTGSGSGGTLNLQVSVPATAPNQSFVTGTTNTRAVAVNGSYIYYAYGNSNIGRANLDGTGANNSFINGTTNLRGIAIDANYIYWTNYTANTIGRANLDGSNVNQSFMTITGASVGQGAYGIAVDSTYIYWSSSGGTIGRSLLNGTGINNTFTSAAATATGIAVDSTYIYWSVPSSGTIGRSLLNGTGVNSTFVSGGTLPYSLAVTSGYLYWGNYGANTLGRANLDGSGVNQSFLTGASNPYGITASTGYLYWGNNLAGTIGRASLGSSAANAQITIASFSGSNGSALFKNAADSTTAFQIQNSAGTSNLFVADTVNSKIGIGVAPTSTGGLLQLAAGTTATGGIQFGSDVALYRSGSGVLTVEGQGTNPSTFVIKATGSQAGADLLQAKAADGTTILAKIDAAGGLTVTSATITGNLTVSGHFITNGGTPTAAAGVAAGAGGSVTITGTDTFGTITVHTGASPDISGVLATVTFNTAFGVGVVPRVVISPSSNTAADSSFYKGTTNNTSFKINVNAIPAYGGTDYVFDYFVGQ